MCTRTTSPLAAAARSCVARPEANHVGVSFWSRALLPDRRLNRACLNVVCPDRHSNRRRFRGARRNPPKHSQAGASTLERA